MGQPLLQIDNLHVVFQTPRGPLNAVRGVNLEVERSQIYGVVGESGCGKSVTGRAILGLVRPPGQVTQGRILFQGDDLRQKSEDDLRRLRGYRIGMIFQDPSTALNPVFRIGQQMALIRKQHRLGGNHREESQILLTQVGLPNSREILRAYPHQLSGGMQQRVMIAMALIAEPDLLIADEPTTALDVTIQAQILELLTELRRERGLTIVLITHDMGVVAESCQQMAVFYAGQVVEQGAVREIFAQPQHPYTQGLLAALPQPQNRGQALKSIAGNVPSGLVPITGCSFVERCESVMPICRQQAPVGVNLETEHQTWCHLYEKV